MDSSTDPAGTLNPVRPMALGAAPGLVVTSSSVMVSRGVFMGVFSNIPVSWKHYISFQ